jgi:hypothetical protein
MDKINACLSSPENHKNYAAIAGSHDYEKICAKLSAISL